MLVKVTSCLRWAEAQRDATGLSPLARTRL